MAEKDEIINEPAQRELTIRRIVNAPRELVFKAWTDPDLLINWWGPAGFTNTFHEISIKPGGVWRFIMHGPDRTDYPNRIVFSEVVAPSLIAYTHDSGEDDDPTQFKTRVTFEDLGDKTRISLQSIFASDAIRDQVIREYGAIEGGRQTLDRMEEQLAAMASGDRKIVTGRVLNYPAQLVFMAFVIKENLEQWWGPKGFTDTIHEFNFAPGGTWRHTMHGPDGKDYKNESRFLEITPSKIVFRHICEPNFTMTITLKDLGDKTEIGWNMLFDTQEIRDNVIKYAADANEENLDRLEAQLEKMMHPAMELTITRFFNAPRELVFKVITEARHVQQWWSPRGFTNPVCEWDAKPGNKIHVEMSGHGGSHPMGGEFKEVVAPEKLVFLTTAFEDAEGNPLIQNQNTITLEEVEGGTKLTLHTNVLKFSPAIAAALAGMKTGWSQSLDKLEEEVADNNPGNSLIINREFNAPRELVFKAWTEPERMAQWWGARGSTIKVARMEVNPGGMFLYSMESPHGNVWGKFVYRDIAAPEKIAFVSSFSDEDGNTTPNAFIPDFPREILNILKLTEKNGKTKLTLKGNPVNASVEEYDAFVKMHEGMHQGFAGTFMALDEYLEKELEVAEA